MMPWRRHRRAKPTTDPRVRADAWQLVSLLLDYPDEQLVGLLPTLRRTVAGLPETIREPLSGFLDHVEASDLADLQIAYVDTFDVTRRCALHLTFSMHGDTRTRGAALVRFKQAYRRAGVEIADEGSELPDHLCVLLEFGASNDADAAWRLLNDHRVAIELLHRALVDRDSPWLPVVQALRATLPRLEGDDHQALAKLIAAGPPQEEVGIDTSPYSIDPAIDEHFAAPMSAAGCGSDTDGGSDRADLGPTIPVGAPR